jgi:hypothetical protein
VARVSGMHRSGERRGRRLASAVGIAGLVTVGIGAGTLHARAAVSTTTTTLSSSNNPASSGENVVLTATVAPTSDSTVPDGTVRFMDGTTNLGTPQPVTAGTPPDATASLTTTFTKAGSGRHDLTATFTPTTGTTSSGALPQDVMGTNASFVDSAYGTMLGRPADTAGGDYWIDQLSNHGVARSTLAMDLASLPEYRRNVISGSGQSGNDFYDLYLHRQFDSAGATYWINRMAGIGGSRLTFEQVRLNFAGSPEFFSSPRVGNNDRSTAIDALYMALLGRSPETGGKAYWMGHYDASVIASQFLFSPEGRAFLVDNVYHQFLARGADPPGQTYWSNLLLSGASDENIIASILSSDEYLIGH